MTLAELPADAFHPEDAETTTDHASPNFCQFCRAGAGCRQRVIAVNDDHLVIAHGLVRH